MHIQILEDAGGAWCGAFATVDKAQWEVRRARRVRRVREAETVRGDNENKKREDPEGQNPNGQGEYYINVVY